MSLNIIAFAGQARSGKTTMAHSFARAALEQGMTPVILSFAGPIKEVAAHEGLTKEENPEEYRLFCQRVGREMRQQDPDYWVKKFSEQLEKYEKKDSDNLRAAIKANDKYSEMLVLIDDLRYENEFNLIRNLQGSVVLVVRNQLPEKNAEWRGHESEEFANYWTSADLDEVEDMFDTAILNDAEDPSLDRLDDMSALIVEQLTSDMPEDFSHGINSKEEIGLTSDEVEALMRIIRKYLGPRDSDD